MNYVVSHWSAGWPVLADPRSGCRTPHPTTIAAFDAMLRDERFAAQHQPTVVLRLGEAPASKVLAQWLSAGVAPQIQIGADGTWRCPAS